MTQPRVQEDAPYGPKFWLLALACLVVGAALITLGLVVAWLIFT